MRGSTHRSQTTQGQCSEVVGCSAARPTCAAMAAFSRTLKTSEQFSQFCILAQRANAVSPYCDGEGEGGGGGGRPGGERAGAARRGEAARRL